MGSRGGCDWEISELQYLFTWKKRLVVSSFSLSDCDNLLKLINCSNNWESSIVQRSRFFVIEKVVVSFWDSTNFGREFLEASSFVFLHQIAHNFLQIVDHIETNNGENCGDFLNIG
ncbi:unnamed protein product [Dracunculus medinensis]|uniref:FBA_2 domain-containing protein n=1 Tax=Dracunculus medinensis TaxID=318479 RepID=A0A0N4UH60_DRAME|nr:unnamed protein product [Dracunculus medinensis]